MQAAKELSTLSAEANLYLLDRALKIARLSGRGYGYKIPALVLVDLARRANKTLDDVAYLVNNMEAQ